MNWFIIDCDFFSVPRLSFYECLVYARPDPHLVCYHTCSHSFVNNFSNHEYDKICSMLESKQNKVLIILFDYPELQQVCSIKVPVVFSVVILLVHRFSQFSFTIVFV